MQETGDEGTARHFHIYQHKYNIFDVDISLNNYDAKRISLLLNYHQLFCYVIRDMVV